MSFLGRVTARSLRFSAALIRISPTQRIFAQPIRYGQGIVRCTYTPADCLDYATEKSPEVSLNDPTEQEAQKLLESGTQKLEVGDTEGAMVCSQLSNFRPTIAKASTYTRMPQPTTT